MVVFNFTIPPWAPTQADDKEEQRRVEKAGGFVLRSRCSRYKGTRVIVTFLLYISGMHKHKKANRMGGYYLSYDGSRN